MDFKISLENIFRKRIIIQKESHFKEHFMHLINLLSSISNYDLKVL